MLSIIRERLRQGHRTIAYPAGEPPPLPDRFRGLPVLDESKCPDGCRACAEACPTDAIARDDQGLRLDLGRCLFCTDCVEACPEGAIRFTQDYRLATTTRDGPGPAERAGARSWRSPWSRRCAASSAGRSSSARSAPAATTRPRPT